MDFDFGTVCFHPLQKIFNLRKQPDFILNEAFQKTHGKLTTWHSYKLIVSTYIDLIGESTMSQNNIIYRNDKSVTNCLTTSM